MLIELGLGTAVIFSTQILVCVKNIGESCKATCHKNATEAEQFNDVIY